MKTEQDWKKKAREAGWTPPEPEWMQEARKHGWTPPTYPQYPGPYRPFDPPFIVTC